ncbi:MAG: hypothetical protein QXF56_01050 [Candidatus Micrarchaeia archaeon]
MRRGVIIFGEEFLSFLVFFLASLLLISNFLLLNKKINSQLIDERMQLVADNIADYIAKKYVDSEGNVDLEKLKVTFRKNVEVRVGGVLLGEKAPDGVDIYAVRRVVFVEGQPAIMEVRVWQ